MTTLVNFLVKIVKFDAFSRENCLFFPKKRSAENKSVLFFQFLKRLIFFIFVLKFVKVLNKPINFYMFFTFKKILISKIFG